MDVDRHLGGGNSKTQEPQAESEMCMKNMIAEVGLWGVQVFGFQIQWHVGRCATPETEDSRGIHFLNDFTNRNVWNV